VLLSDGSDVATVHSLHGYCQ